MEDLRIEGAKVIFRNFGGAPTKFNPAGGKREFSVLLTTEQAEGLRDDGWNVKPLSMREDDEEQMWHLSVSVRFSPVPPKVYLITSHSKTVMGENDISQLDYSQFRNVDLVINPYKWEANGKTGIKAYLKAGYFVVLEDSFEEKYANWGNEEDELPF